jgi:hypothetical protein
MVNASDQPGTSTAPDGDAAEAFAGWPDFTELALVRAEEELPRWGRSTLEFRDAANPNAKPFFALDDKDEVQHWEYVKGLYKHYIQSLRMVTDTLVRHMSGAFEVSHVCFNILFGSYPLFSLVLTLGLTMVRSSRSDHAANHFLFAMKVVCVRHFLVNRLWSRRPISGYPRRAPKQMSCASSTRRLRRRQRRLGMLQPKHVKTRPKLKRRRP